MSTRRFRPALGPSLIVLAVTPVLIALGVWQLQRSDWKSGIISQFEQRQHAAPIDLSTSGSAALPADMRYRRVTVTGRLDAGHQFLLDNRTHGRKAGYHVLTVLTSESGRAFLVNRGWVEAGQQRSELPDVGVDAGPVTISGLIKAEPESGLLLSDIEERRQSWPRVIQRVDFDRLSELLGLQLEPLVILLDPDSAAGYVREWRANYGIPPEKHTAYAVQWFALAVVLIGGYIALSLQEQKTGATPEQVE